METTIIVSHEVKNFEEWKKGFDNEAPMRDGAGLKLKNIYRAADNTNMVTIILTAPNIEVAKGLTSNPELQAAMKKAGVISAPEFKILNSAN